MKVLVDMISKKIIGINQDEKVLTYTIDVLDCNPSKTMTENINIQKVDSNGNFLYLKEIEYKDATGKIQKKLEEVNVPHETISEKVVFYKPSLQKIEQQSTYTLLENPSMFTVEDITRAKASQIIKNTTYKYIILDEELDEQDLDISSPNNSAITGVKTLKILPNGQCTTNSINLPESVNSIGLYIEADPEIRVEVGYADNTESAQTFVPFVNNSATLTNNVSSVVVKFTNSSSTDIKQITAYGILC